MTSISLAAISELIKELSLKIDSLINLDEKINAAAAKVIQEITDKIDKCCSSEKLAEKLKEQAIVPSSGKNKEISGLTKYSYPNDWVGNPNLGSSKNPGALTWPFGQ